MTVEQHVPAGAQRQVLASNRCSRPAISSPGWRNITNNEHHVPLCGVLPRTPEDIGWVIGRGGIRGAGGGRPRAVDLETECAQYLSSRSWVAVDGTQNRVLPGNQPALSARASTPGDETYPPCE